MMVEKKYWVGSMNVYQAEHILYVASRCKKLSYPDGIKELITRLVDLHFYLRANSLKDTELFKQLDKRVTGFRNKEISKDVFNHLQDFMDLHAILISYQFRLKP